MHLQFDNNIYIIAHNIKCVIACLAGKISFIHYEEQITKKIFNSEGPNIDPRGIPSKISSQQLWL